MNEPDQLLKSKDFWETFYESIVVKQQWKSDVEADSDNRNWNQLKDNNDHWSILVYNACWELSHRKEGHRKMEFQRLGLKSVLMDYVLHLHYFHLVSSVMRQKGFRVDVQGHNNSNIHDIDKLNPLMLAGYTHSCLQSHLTKNPHHETHPIWHQDFCPHSSQFKNNCSHCENERGKALNEMICDKVSRRVQKELQGEISSKMWDIELYWFSSLPLKWQERGENSSANENIKNIMLKFSFLYRNIGFGPKRSKCFKLYIVHLFRPYSERCNLQNYNLSIDLKLFS